MDAEKFIAGIKGSVEHSTISGTLRMLQKPTKSASEEKRAYSNWWHGLSEAEQSHVRNIVTDTVQFTVFNFLCVLDGVAAVENLPHTGKLKLVFKKHDGSQVLLTDAPRVDELHSIYGGTTS